MRSLFAHRVCFTALLAADIMLRISDTRATRADSQFANSQFAHRFAMLYCFTSCLRTALHALLLY
jgi:hypothetical protein